MNKAFSNSLAGHNKAAATARAKMITNIIHLTATVIAFQVGGWKVALATFIAIEAVIIVRAIAKR